MSRWSDIQNGRVDLVADDRNGDTGRGWELYRILIETYGEIEPDRAFITRLTSPQATKLELHMDIADAVKRCMEWMG